MPAACPAVPWVMVAAAERHGCGIVKGSPTATQGVVRCWGDASDGKLRVPNAWAEFVAVDTKFQHACAIESSTQRLTCWGPGPAVPANLTAQRWASIAVGERQTCSITVAGTLHCFGPGAAAPPTLPSRLRWSKVAVGKSHVVALTSNNTILSWATPAARTQARTLVAVPRGGGVGMLVAGHTHSCALFINGSLACWNARGGTLRLPPDIARRTWSWVTAGSEFSCALSRDKRRRLTCWPASGDAPTRLLDTINAAQQQEAIAWLSVSAAADSVCGVVNNASFNVVCYDNRRADRAAPPESTGLTWVAVAAGNTHACGKHLAGT